MTPMQIMGYFRLAMKAKRRERAELLSLYSIAARAEGKEIKAQLKDLMDDGDNA